MVLHPMSVRRSAASLGLATVLGHASQLVWLAAAVRVMPAADFGTVLAAQALYAVLQVIVDVGTNGVGARMAARSELGDQQRGQILRMRLALALGAAPIALALGAAGVSGSFAATLPFVVALGLFAALNVWEPYGSGDARPWATYTFARSGVLAAVACAFLVAGARFPVALAGILECSAIIVTMFLFGRAPLASLRLGAGARGGPWRSVVAIGGPACIAQSSMAAGTLVLSAAGSPARAGVFAACVRLLTGVNAINGVVAASLYPRFARGAAEGSDDRRVVTVALGVIAVVAAGATATGAFFGGPLAVAFLGGSTTASIAALVLTLAVALPLGNIVMFTLLMVARGHERVTLLPYALGGPLTAALAIAAVVVAGARVDLAAISLLVGQLVTMAGLGLRVRATCPDIAPATDRSMALALLVGLLACASLLPGGTVPAGLGLFALVGVLSARLRPLAGSLPGDLWRGRRRRGSPRTEDHHEP